MRGKRSAAVGTGARMLNIFHLDLNYVNLKKEYLRDWLAKLKGMGFNAVLWELEDKVRWETCPECVWPEAMSKREFKELLAFSRKLGLEPIPLLQTVGHAEYVLMHRRYRAFRELRDRHDCYCTSNPKVTKFLKDCIEEYMGVFGDIRYFHLGGDEAYVFARCPRCSAYAGKHGRDALFGNHIRAISEPLLRKGIRPGIWNDMIMKDPDALGFDRSKYVVWDWNYWDTDKAPERINLHALGHYTLADIHASGMLKEFPELLDPKGRLRPFASVRILKRHGFDVILCSASRSHGDTFFCPAPAHCANIAAAARTAASEKLLGHCVTSWAIRLNDYAVQIPSIGLAGYACSRPWKSSDELFHSYCRELFGTDPEKFIRAVKLLGVSLPFAQSSTTGVQWNGMKDSMPAPKGYLKRFLLKLKKTNPERLDSFRSSVGSALAGTPEGIRLLAEFFQKARKGHEIVDAWLSAAHFLLTSALAAENILEGRKTRGIAGILEKNKKLYETFLEIRETPLSARKNAGLAYDSIIDYFKGKTQR